MELLCLVYIDKLAAYASIDQERQEHWKSSYLFLRKVSFPLKLVLSNQVLGVEIGISPGPAILRSLCP